MNKKLFGTDGIRGVANKYPISCEIALKLGRAVGLLVKKEGYKSIIIGKDTRKSGDMLEAALLSGIVSTGINGMIAGIIPTPGVAYLATKLVDVGAGIVISASHNPYQDNGIKVFNGQGEKLDEQAQNFIENFIHNNNKFTGTDDIGEISIIKNSKEQYADFLQSTIDFNLIKKRIRVVIDCSNGAAFKTAPLVFSNKNFETKFIFNKPDGENINELCGSQHTEALSKEIIKQGFDIGLGFDGDADRLIAVDEKGNQVKGDKILAICSKYLKEQGALTNNTVVSTVMSNVGLIQFLKDSEIKHIITDVGDANVIAEMKKNNAVIGGEDSGHLIFSKYHTTGDGILSALRLIEVMAVTDKSLSELAQVMKVYPQVLMNVEVDQLKPDFMKVKEISKKIKQIETELGSNGRVLIRYSGTQPLLRVMIEGPDKKTTEDYCEQICEVIKTYI
ncbi:MAG: phosphoglucosamine mutase [Desulfobacteraceae bacterium]|nr:phosphoglucosamine mutase [Desulfobacteraceae bacterium]